MNFDEYDDATLREDPDGLRARFAEDGVVFLRGLLDAGVVAELRRQVLDRLQGVGWLRPGTDPGQALPGDRVHHDRGVIDGRPVRDPEWSVGYQAVQSLEALHRLAHDPALLAVLSDLLNGEVVVHPRKIARIAFPDLPFPTPPHQDALFNRVTADVLTVWIPLGDCAAASGGLRVLLGSAGWGVLPAVPDDGLGGESVAVDVDDPGWLEGDYRAGDLIIFHGRSVHMAPANRGSTLRLSVDFRYQRADEPMTPAMLSPHGHASGQLPGWSELTAGWRTARWVEVGRPVRVVAVPPAVLPPSRLVPESGRPPGA